MKMSGKVYLDRFIGEYLQGCLKVSVDEQLGTAKKRNLSE